MSSRTPSGLLVVPTACAANVKWFGIKAIPHRVLQPSATVGFDKWKNAKIRARTPRSLVQCIRHPFFLQAPTFRKCRPGRGEGLFSTAGPRARQEENWRWSFELPRLLQKSYVEPKPKSTRKGDYGRRCARCPRLASVLRTLPGVRDTFDQTPLDGVSRPRLSTRTRS